jgi:TPR repeat protein
MYNTGRGVDQDYVEGRRWYTLAAQQGDSNVQNNLGGMHFYGVGGGPVDYAAAATWWKRAADQGDANAITNLPRALSLLFPPGTRIELVKMPAPRINGMRGVVDATRDGKIVCSGVGKIAVVLEGGRGTKAVLFENLVGVPPTEAEEKRRKKKEKAARQKARKQAVVASDAAAGAAGAASARAAAGAAVSALQNGAGGD